MRSRRRNEETSEGRKVFLQFRRRGDGTKTEESTPLPTDDGHLQKLSRSDQDAAGALLSIPGRHVGGHPGTPAGRVRVPVSVPEAPMELLRPRPEEPQSSRQCPSTKRYACLKLENPVCERVESIDSSSRYNTRTHTESDICAEQQKPLRATSAATA